MYSINSHIVNWLSDLPSRFLFGHHIPHEKMEVEEFWHTVKNYLQEDLSWKFLSLGDLTISREKLALWTTLDLPISPQELKKHVRSISVEELEKLISLNVEPIHKATFIGSQEVCAKLLEKGCNIHAVCKGKKATIFKGYTPLAIAFSHKHDDLFQFLVEQGADIRADFLSLPFFHKYAIRHRKKFAPLLIEHGLLEEQMKTDSFGRSNLHYAAQKGELETLTFLLDCGADVNLLNSVYNEIPLWLAVECGKTDSVQLLIDRGANTNFQKYGRPLLFAAIETGQTESVRLLLENGANPNLSDKFWNAPLKQAVAIGDQASVSLLLEFNANPHITDRNGKNLIDLAIEKKYLSLIPLFLRKGVKINQGLLDAIKQKYEKLVTLFLQNATLKDLNVKDKHGLSLLHIAAYQGNKDWIIQLLEKGMDVNVQTSTGITPLHLAAIRGLKDIVQLLIENGADVNAIDYTGNTPFHHALTYIKTLPVAYFLLEAGAKPLLNPLSFYNKFKQIRLEKLQGYAKEAKLQDPHLHMRWKEQYLRKLCAHCFNVGGGSVLTDKKNNQAEPHTITLEGFTSPVGFLKKIAKNTLEFSRQCPKLLSQQWAKKISSLCSFTAKDSQLTDADYVKRIRSKQPTLLLSGYWNHSIEIIIWKDFYIECNKHDGKSVEVFCFDPTQLTPKTIHNIRLARACDKTSYLRTKSKLPVALVLHQNDGTKKIERICNSLPPQLTGNCQWVNFETTTFALLATKLEDEKVKEIFSPWLLFQQLTFLQQYLDLHLSGKSPYHPDYKLIDAAVVHLNKIDSPLPPSLDKMRRSTLKKAETLITSCLLTTIPLPQVSEKHKKTDSLLANSQLIDTEEEISYALLYEQYFFKESPEERMPEF